MTDPTNVPEPPATYDPRQEAQYYLIGRKLLDGADRIALAKQLEVNVEVIDKGWEVSQEQLSLHLTELRKQPFRLLTMEELRRNIKVCLSCLLKWQAANGS